MFNIVLKSDNESTSQRIGHLKIPGILDGDEEFKLMHKKINQ